MFELYGCGLKVIIPFLTRFNHCLIKASCYSLPSLKAKTKKAENFIRSVTGSHSCHHPWRTLYLLTKPFVLLTNECQSTDTVQYLTFGVLNWLIYLSIHASELKKTLTFHFSKQSCSESIRWLSRETHTSLISLTSYFIVYGVCSLITSLTT